MSKYVAVTGVAGFIGRHVAQQLLARGDYVYGIDALTYAADPACVERFQRGYPDKFCFINNDIRHLGRWPDVDCVIHLAAETHVDNSLDTPNAFIETNVNGTAHLLEMTRRKQQHGAPRFIYVSTDEIYGSIPDGQYATADSPIRPSSPYAASKAAADLLVQAWGQTYGIPYTIVRPTNCYGIGQYPEKLIPKTIRSLLLGRPVPIHGDGSALRQWLKVDDAADAILRVLDLAEYLPSVINVGGNAWESVMEVVSRIAFAMKKPLITERRERPGLDARYAIDDTPLRAAGWLPTGCFAQDIPQIVENEVRNWRF